METKELLEILAQIKLKIFQISFIQGAEHEPVVSASQVIRIVEKELKKIK